MSLPLRSLHNRWEKNWSEFQADPSGGLPRFVLGAGDGEDSGAVRHEVIRGRLAR